MISKFDGRCHYCKTRTFAGKDEYDFDSKISYHADCKEKDESAPSSEQFALALRLGFIEWNQNVATDGLLRRMLSANRGAATGRPESAPPSRQVRDLFEE